jgi:hypothetical protein
MANQKPDFDEASNSVPLTGAAVDKARAKKASVQDPARAFGSTGMENAQKKFDDARADAKKPKGFDKSRLDAASEPVTSDTGVPNDLIVSTRRKRLYTNPRSKGPDAPDNR